MAFVQFWQHAPELRLAVYQRRALPATHRFRDHEHLFHELGFVLDGECHWAIGRQRLRVGAGGFVLVPPGRRHREVIPAGRHARLAWVGFDFGVTEVAAPAWSLQACTGGPWSEELHRLVKTIFTENQSADLGGRERAQLALREILILTTRAATAPRTAVSPAPVNPAQEVARSAARYLTDNFAQPLSVQAVARYHSLGAAHFSVIFRKHHGLTPRAFLQKIRLDRARALLAAGDMRIKEIAATCGYADAAHFCRSFKAATDQTPGRCRVRRPAA